MTHTADLWTRRRAWLTQTVAAIAGLTIGVPAVLAQDVRVTTYDYSDRGDLIEVRQTNPSGADITIEFAYTDAGDLAVMTDGAGRVVQASYDEARRIETFTVAPSLDDQMHTRYRYDSMGRITHVDVSSTGSTAPVQWITSQATYSPDGRVLSLRDPRNHVQTYTYDAAGRLSTAADGASRTSRTTYWPDGLVHNIFEAYGTDEQVVAAQQYYNALGERGQLRPANGLGANPGVQTANGLYDTLWEFDAYGRVGTVRYPRPADGASAPSESFGYDANGNLTSHTTRAGEAISMVYDASSRLTHKTTPQGTTVTTYNLAGEPVSVTAPDPHVSGDWQLDYGYDFAGRMVSETQTSPENETRTVSYEYDGAGNRTRITWPDGYYVTYAYDQANRLTHVRSMGSALIARYQYDAQGRLDRYTVNNLAGAMVGEIVPAYELDSDLASLSYEFQGEPTANVLFDYDYDGAGYLISQDIGNAAWAWSPATTTATYSVASYETNRLDQYAAVSGTSYSYDLNGNLTSDGLRSFTYSAENQLLTATTLSGGLAEYSYGPAARRVRKTVDGVGTDYLHAGDMEIAEYDSVSGDLLRRYIPGAGVDQRVAIVECGASSACIPGGSGVTTRFYFADRQGNVLALANEDGTLNQQFLYTPFGVELVGDASESDSKFPGGLTMPCDAS